jgi:hypothetical protein
VSDTEIAPRPVPVDTDGGDDDRLAHIGRAADVNRAYVTGEEITALCGKRFVPSRDPERYPVCQACLAALQGIKAARSGAN